MKAVRQSAKLESSSKVMPADADLSVNKRKLFRMLRTRAARHAKYPVIGCLGKISSGHHQGKSCEALRLIRHSALRRPAFMKIDDLVVRVRGIVGVVTIRATQFVRNDWEDVMIPSVIIRTLVEDTDEIAFNKVHNWKRFADSKFKHALLMWNQLLPGADTHEHD